ncbi:MAG: CRISPR-associated endonuclease Cas2 [Propioniciclava sp.]
MRNRHRFLLAYDIRDPRRLRLVHRMAKEFGWAMQYSVFVADLDGVELSELKMRLAEVLDHSADSVAIINVGLPDERGRSSFQFLGVKPMIPTVGPVVI